jgi:hypothetical protein
VLVQEELAKQQVTILPRPLYSPDLAPSDLFSFSHLKEKLSVSLFQWDEKIVTATRKAVWDLPANVFQQCFKQLY